MVKNLYIIIISTQYTVCITHYNNYVSNIYCKKFNARQKLKIKELDSCNVLKSLLSKNC